jgi:IS5 family transposase
VLTAADENTAIAVDVVPGQTHEASHLEPMLEATTARVPDMEEGVADKGFDGEPQRQAFQERGIKPVIPYKANRVKRGQLDKKAYRETALRREAEIREELSEAAERSTAAQGEGLRQGDAP